METLTNSVAKISPVNLTAANTRWPLLQGRSHVRFIRSSKPKSIKLHCSSLSVPNAKASEDLETIGTEMQITQISTTVHIKFQLQKECFFGDQFFLVGDDPVLGLWNPMNAIPLNWSDGHIWTVEMDLPVGLPIQFKFILKQSTGEIQWQPGPDRIFRTWEAEKTLVITEDWEDAEMQKITEEQMMSEPLVPNAEQKIFIDSDMSKTNMEHQYGCSAADMSTEGPVLMPDLNPLQLVSSAEESFPWEYGNVVAENSMGFSAE